MSKDKKEMDTIKQEVEVTKETSASSTKSLEDSYKLEHRGGGRYRIEGSTKLYPSKREALAAAMAREVASADDDEFGDIIPEGWDKVSVTDRSLVRHSPMELAMNERYLEDGTRNPYYDREWEWVWGHLSRDSISQKRAQQFQLVTMNELEEYIRDGRVPEHIRSLVYEEGDYLIHKDAVLMRIPRFILTQRRVEREKHAIKGMTESHRQSLEELGSDSRIPDSVLKSLDLENSLESFDIEV